jgi:hypothetical protein
MRLVITLAGRAALEAVGQRQDEPVVALAGGGEDDELGIGELGHDGGSLASGPRPSWPFYHREPRVPFGARGVAGKEPLFGVFAFLEG